MPELPLVGNHGQIKSEPVAVLERRVVKQGSNPATQMLVRWTNLPDIDATWKDYRHIRQRFLNLWLRTTQMSRGVECQHW
jgi:hypothetical protein